MRSLITIFFLLSLLHDSRAQNELTQTSHKVLGADVPGYKVNIPFGKSAINDAWKEYAKPFGRNEPAQSHMTYQSVFKPSIYDKEVLIFAKIEGDNIQGSLWMGIDPQGIPKEKLELLQNELKPFVYDFNLKVRTDAAQKRIDESEQAATYLSKQYETLKREARRNQRNYQKTNDKIERYELELITLRSDSILYEQNIVRLDAKLDSMYSEIEKIKAMVALYKNQMETID